MTKTIKTYNKNKKSQDFKALYLLDKYSASSYNVKL